MADATQAHTPMGMQPAVSPGQGARSGLDLLDYWRERVAESTPASGVPGGR